MAPSGLGAAAGPAAVLETADPRASVAPDAGSELGTLTSLAVGVVIVVALYVGREVLVPIALAIMLSFVLAPLVRLLRRAWLGRVPAVFLAVLLALGAILSLGGLIGVQMSQLVSGIPGYARTIDQKVAGIRAVALDQMSGIIAAIGQPVRPPAPPAKPPASRAAAAAAKDTPAPPTVVEVHQPDPTPIEIAERILLPVVSPLATTGIVFMVAIFILLQHADLRDRFIRLFGLKDLQRTTRALDDTARRLSRYLLTQLGLNAFFGLVIGLGLLVIGVPNALLWGTLGGLFRFVPYFGSVLAGLLPATLAAAVEPGWGMAGATVALFVVTEVVMGQFVDPPAYGRSTGLSPISVVVAAIFWTWMWGPIGLILSMPLTVCLVVLGRHVRRLEFLDVLMGDRPALTPVERFYQRVLANDPDEALEYAEIMLKSRSLSAYYDEVAVQGLQRAALDAERGVLSAAGLARMQAAMVRLVDELDDFEDQVPATARPRAEATSGMDLPPGMALPERVESVRIDPLAGELAGAWASPAAVLCVAGGGPFDQAVADMLVQLLIKNGLGARAVPFAAVSREAIGGLDVSGVAMVSLCYLDIGTSPSQLRYLVRRIRRIVPQAPVLAGLWVGETAQAGEDRLQAAMDADHYMSSLGEGVNICLALARAAAPAPGAA